MTRRTARACRSVHRQAEHSPFMSPPRRAVAEAGGAGGHPCSYVDCATTAVIRQPVPRATDGGNSDDSAHQLSG